MEQLTYNEYWTEIKGIADSIVCEALQSVEIDNNNEPMDFDDKKEQAMDLINDSLLHETIDGHQWVIYYAYNLDVIKNSNNEDYMADNISNDFSGFDSLNSLHGAVAFWAMYADVQEYIDDAFNEYEEKEAA